MFERNGELHRFLHRDVGSDESLRILLYLATNADLSLAVDDIRTHVHVADDPTSVAIATKRVELRLEALIEKRLVRRDMRAQTYQYAPDHDGSGHLVEQILKADGNGRDEMARMIYTPPRVAAAAAFADAFSRRRDDA
jgi:hypothetical protein